MKYGAQKLLEKFPEKPWTKGGLDKLLRKTDETGSTNRTPGIERRKSARIEENIEVVNDLAQSQENEEPGSQRPPHEIKNILPCHVEFV